MFDHTIGAIDPVNDATRSETSSSEQSTLLQSLTGKPAPEVVRVFGLQPVWPLAHGT